MDTYSVVLNYGELGQREYDNFKNKIVLFSDVRKEDAEDFVKIFNKGLGEENKPYCPMKYSVETKTSKR